MTDLEYVKAKSGTIPDSLDDAALQDLIDSHDDLDSAIAEVWEVKAATFAEWYQTGLDGSFLSRQQAFEHCLRMAEYFAGVAGGRTVSVLMTTSPDPDDDPEFAS